MGKYHKLTTEQKKPEYASIYIQFRNSPNHCMVGRERGDWKGAQGSFWGAGMSLMRELVMQVCSHCEKSESCVLMTHVLLCMYVILQ